MLTNSFCISLRCLTTLPTTYSFIAIQENFMSLLSSLAYCQGTDPLGVVSRLIERRNQHAYAAQRVGMTRTVAAADEHDSCGNTLAFIHAHARTSPTVYSIKYSSY